MLAQKYLGRALVRPLLISLLAAGLFACGEGGSDNGGSALIPGDRVTDEDRGGTAGGEEGGDPGGATDPSGGNPPTDPSSPGDTTDPGDSNPGGSGGPIIIVPTNPGDPTGPTGPTSPTEPTSPTDPTNPTDPTDPSGPTDPAGPEGGDYTLDTAFATPAALLANLRKMAAIADPAARAQVIDQYWQKLGDAGSLPFVVADSATVLTREPGARQVFVAGDHNRWQLSSGSVAENIAGTDIWYHSAALPPAARAEYKIVVDGEHWQADAGNPARDREKGNSVLAMPGYEKTAMLTVAPAERGTLSSSQQLHSSGFNDAIAYRVYTPFGYQAGDELPVIYFVDGQNYLDEQKGNGGRMLDNLIESGALPPLLAVFIDSVSPSTGLENNALYYVGQPAVFADFVTRQLIPEIEGAYDLNPGRSPQQRALVGAGFSGYFALYTCVLHRETVAKCAAQSPSLWADSVVRDWPGSDSAAATRIDNKSALKIALGDSALRVNTRIALSTGTLGDTVLSSLESKLAGVDHIALQTAQGHNWGNWSDTLPELLSFLFSQN